MSQRNPMNDRYQSDEVQGKTRKSAASAKPATKAASSVIIESTEKTPAEKRRARKEARRAEGQRQRELDRKYYNPNTPRYKKLRAIWVVCLVMAVVCIFVSYNIQGIQIFWLPYVVTAIAYALIIVAFYIDLRLITRERRKYQEEMLAKEEREKRERKMQARRNKANAKAKGSGVNASRNPKVQQANAEANAEEKAKTVSKKAADGSSFTNKPVKKARPAKPAELPKPDEDKKPAETEAPAEAEVPVEVAEVSETIVAEAETKDEA